MSNSRTLRFKQAGALARTSRTTNPFKGGMSLMGWAKGSGAAAGVTFNVYGSSDDGTPVGTGQQGDGNSQITDDTSKQTLICTLHPTTSSTGATGCIDVQANVVCYWDYLFVEAVSPEGTTIATELTISGADRP
jgi:hypothetical protein